MPCGQPVWVPRHAHGHHKPRLVWPAVACPWAPQTEVSGMPHGLPWCVTWPALGGCQGMPWPAWVEGCRGMPVGTTKPRLVACHGLPLGVPWHAFGGATPVGAVACLGGCHGAAKACHGLPCWVPWWAPWHAITLNPVPRCIYSFGNDPNCAPKFFVGHLGRVPCFNSH